MSIKSITRYHEIARVLIKHGFGYLIDNIEIKAKKERLAPAKKHSLPKRVRLLFEDLGPTFIKMGQLLSMRPDLVPEEFVKEFENLQDHVEEIGWPVVEKQIISEFGRPADEVFAGFSKEPLASASIGQVHKALLPSGESVAVKVQRYQLRQLITGDISIMKSLSPALQEKTIIGQLCNVDEIIEVFERQIHKEMDYNVEALNTECFYHEFLDDDRVLVPKVYWEYTTERVLAMEYVEGMRVEQFLQTATPELREKAARNLIWAVFQPLLAKGIFHGDPHPGNAMFNALGNVVFLDFGITGRLDSKLRNQIAELILALEDRDIHAVMEIIKETGVVEGRINEQHFFEDVAELVERANGVTSGGMELGQLINGMLDISIRHRIRMPDNLFILGKVVVITEGMARKLAPHIDIAEILQPLALEHLKENLQPGFRAGHFYRQLAESLRMLVDLPRNLTIAVRSLAKGDMRITFYHRNLNWLYDMLDISSSRISYSLIIASLIVGSALIMHTGRGPLLWGFPALGTVGFLFSTLLGVWVIFDLLRSKKIK